MRVLLGGIHCSASRAAVASWPGHLGEMQQQPEPEPADEVSPFSGVLSPELAADTAWCTAHAGQLISEIDRFARGAGRAARAQAATAAVRRRRVDRLRLDGRVRYSAGLVVRGGGAGYRERERRLAVRSRLAHT